MDLKCFLIFACSFIYATAQITINDCPSILPRDRYLRAHGTSCYSFVIAHSREYPDAERECESRRGHLVTVKNAETNAFLASTLRNEFHYDDVVWIGLTDQRSEGHWEWIDGTPVGYTNWAAGQPGLLSTFEDCAALDVSDSRALWHDYSCTDILFVHKDHYFVCEYPVAGLTTNTHMTTTTTMPTKTTPQPTTTTPQPTTSTPAPTTTTPAPTTTTPAPTTTTPEPTTTTPQPTTTTPQPTTTTTTTTPAPTTTTTTTTPAPTTTTTTPAPTTTTPTPTTPKHTTHPHSTHGSGHGHQQTTACPPFSCGLDCGLAGYQISAEGCMLCACEA